MDVEKKRGSNCTEQEKIALITSVNNREDVLFGKLKGCGGGRQHVTTEDKRQAWKAVCNEVNSVSSVKRSLDKVKKQYDNIKQGAKERLDGVKRPKTGGGPREQVPKSTEFFLETHDTRPSVVGLDVNLDTCDGPLLLPVEDQTIETNDGNYEIVILGPEPTCTNTNYSTTAEPVPNDVSSPYPTVNSTVRTVPNNGCASCSCTWKRKRPEKSNLKEELLREEIKKIKLEQEKVMLEMSFIKLKFENALLEKQVFNTELNTFNTES